MPTEQPQFAAGQVWAYDAPAGFETSRILIGAIASFSGSQRICCCAVTGAPGRDADGEWQPVDIPFLAMTETALAATVTGLDAAAAAVLPEAFAPALQEWQTDPRGLSCFTVPFDGDMNHMIARQMAAIIGSDAA
ncbi:MAG: hypothetical protein KDJ18_03810 [Hyphomicrobiaceae bacterium]|nr:hypothetical protein [Hyphomicrobiaceae bacterium]